RPWPRFSPPLRPHPRAFHTTPRLLSDDASPNHYDALQLAPTATSAEIKRQFYALSKKHHPDRNPSDPTASTRFVQISEAYHTLSVPEKRSQYDAHLRQSQSQAQSRASRWGTGPPAEGSYSSAAFGARPASGLNKKRTTFRGPPPSFYKSGGYGQHGAKRSEYAHHDPRGGEQAGQESYGDYGGFGPGQQRQGSEVPHFDDRRHKETHDSLNEHIYARRRRSKLHRVEEVNRGSVVMNFLLVSGAIAI
ncbi:DnaJ-domain-containing protein, partial [Dothidotthia symphoricarpi CBS 119687]